MVHRTMMIDVYLWWCTVSGAGPLFPGHKTVGVQSGCCVRCGEGEAEEKRWVMRGRVEGASTVGGDGYGTEERERERERERENHSGIREWVLSTELIKTSPFNGPLSPPTSPLLPLPNTRVYITHLHPCRRTVCRCRRFVLVNRF